MKLSKTQSLANLRNSDDKLAIFLLKDCESLSDVKNTIAHMMHFWLSVEEQIKKGDTMQWFYGDKYYKNQSQVDLNLMAYYRIAFALNYTVKLSDTFVYFK